MKFKKGDRIIRKSGSKEGRGIITYRRCNGQFTTYYVKWWGHSKSIQFLSTGIDSTSEIDKKYYRDKSLTNLLE